MIWRKFSSISNDILGSTNKIPLRKWIFDAYFLDRTTKTNPFWIDFLKFTLALRSRLIAIRLRTIFVGGHSVHPHLYVCYINGRMISSPTNTICFDSNSATYLVANYSFEPLSCKFWFVSPLAFSRGEGGPFMVEGVLAAGGPPRRWMRRAPFSVNEGI